MKKNITIKIFVEKCRFKLFLWLLSYFKFSCSELIFFIKSRCFRRIKNRTS